MSHLIIWISGTRCPASHMFVFKGVFMNILWICMCMNIPLKHICNWRVCGTRPPASYFAIPHCKWDLSISGGDAEHTHIHTHTRIHTRTRTNIHTHTHTHTPTRDHTHTDTHAQTHTHTHTYIHTHTHAHSPLHGWRKYLLNGVYSYIYLLRGIFEN